MGPLSLARCSQGLWPGYDHGVIQTDSANGAGEECGGCELPGGAASFNAASKLEASPFATNWSRLRSRRFGRLEVTYGGFRK